MNISGPAAVAKPEMLFYAPGDLTVTFLMIRSKTLLDGSKGFILFSEEYKKSEPFSYRKKVRILLL